MNFGDILVIGFGLAMDAFAISVCKGLTMLHRDLKKTFIIAGYFAFFQMLMPLLGFLAGNQLSTIVASVAHWIAFALLVLIGGNMIRDSFHPDSNKANDDVSFKTMFPLAIATSIDALITGVTFAFLSVNIWTSILLIGAITFLVCTAGVLLGKLIGARLQNHAELLGGIILILIGLKILIEHLSSVA